MIYTIKNDLFSVAFDNLGFVTSLNYTGRDNVAEKTPIAILTKFDKTESLPVSANLNGDIITVTFDNGIETQVKVKTYSEFITFTLDSVSSEEFHSVAFFNAKVNIDYDNEEKDPSALSACLMSLTLATHMKEHSGKNEVLMATAYTHIGIAGNSRSPYKPACAITLCENKDLIRIEREILDIIPDGELPKSKRGGPYAKNASESAKKTYTLHWTVINDDNFDEQVAYFRSFGIEQINIHNSMVYYAGSYEVMESAYPGGLEEFKRITKRLKAEGFELGFHPYVFFINPNDRYISPIPHEDIDVLREFTLKEDISLSDSEIFTVERLDGVTPFLAYVFLNSQTMRIDDELVKFKAVDESGRFYQVERGVLGTKVAEHKKGAKIYQYKEYFFHYLAKAGSKLFYEMARNMAKLYNEIGFDSIYFDALDGAAQLEGEDYAWYHAMDFVREFFAHIDHDPTFDACHNMQYTGTWFVRSRFGAVDREIIAYNDYKESQAHYNKKVARRMGVNEEFGWLELYPETPRSEYYLQVMPQRKENFAFLYGKLMATGGCTTYLEVIPKKQQIPAVLEYRDIIKEYNDYKNAHELSQESKDYLLSERAECLIDNGVLKKATFNVYRFEHLDKVNKIINKFDTQKPFIRIENLYSAKDYDTDGIVIHGGCTLSNGDNIKTQFEAVDLSKHLGLGVWIKGDNGGGLVEFTIGLVKGGTPCRGVMYIRNDFEGWRYFALVEHQQGDEREIPVEEVDNSTYANLQKFYGYYISAMDYSRVETFNINYRGGGSVEIKPIKAVAHEERDLVNPTLIINGKKIKFNATLKSTHTLECDYNGNVRVIDKKFNLISTPTFDGELPVLLNGENIATFESDSEKQTRVRITVGLLGENLE
ncbi:MAG: hypothetical protein J6V66_06095 [Clostridia bacterium]|nr:hypothetical protein [Clostridia bacterium]